MKFNNETSMELRLQESIQQILEDLNCLSHSREATRLSLAALSGISTAIHALTGEIWTCERWPDGYVFVNESRTECISTEL